MQQIVENMDVPPAQDSPKHILNVLNNDCIGEILRRLPTLKDFVIASEVCIRFRDSAQASFPPKHKDVDINRRPLNSNYQSTERVPALLINFGHLIQSIDWKPSSDRHLNNQLFEMMGKYCGKTLKTLIITLNIVNFNKRTKFEALTRFELYKASTKNFRLNSPLKILKIGPLDSMKEQPWFIRTFPHLESVEFFNVKKLTDELLIQFISQNSQLKKLTVHGCKLLSPSILKLVGDLLPNLEDLHIDHCPTIYRSYTMHEVNDNMMHMTKLRKLQSLKFDWPYQLEKLLNMFVENDISIESLSMAPTFPNSIENWPTLKTLKHLELDEGFSDEMLINLVRCQPSLETITLWFCSNEEILSWYGLKKLLEYGKHLHYIKIFTFNYDMDFETYTSILDLAMNRVKVYIETFGTINVPNDILEKNRKWLDIRE